HQPARRIQHPFLPRPLRPLHGPAAQGQSRGGPLPVRRPSHPPLRFL
ncbi:hypothetical protein BN1708_020060, partial [Verticillium longisporum]